MADEDSDAPEEFTLEEGRDAAQTLRMEENDNQKRIAADAKLKRQRRNGQNENEGRTEAPKLVKEQQVVEEHQTEEDMRLNSKNTGILDESIVQYLVAKEREKKQKADEEHEAAAATAAAVKPKRKKKKLGTSERIKVVVLGGENKELASARNGRGFLHDRLFGSRIRRSQCMLQNLSPKRKTSFKKTSRTQ